MNISSIYICRLAGGGAAVWRSPVEFPAPSPDGLIGSDRECLGFGQKQLDIRQAEAERVVQPDGVADDLRRESDGGNAHWSGFMQPV